MFKVLILLSIFLLIVSTRSNKAPFIDPCHRNDKECLKTSSQKALPYIADGVPDLGTSPVDPMLIKSITINEGGLNVVFNNMKLHGLKQCQITDIERNIQDESINMDLVCPIDVTGQYVASGKVIFEPVEGDGPFHVKSDKVLISVTMDLKNVGNHWKIGKCVHTFEFKEKALLQFDNIFNGDQSKAAPVMKILDNQWKELVQTVGKPIVGEAVDKVCVQLQNFMDAVPINELERT